MGQFICLRSLQAAYFLFVLWTFAPPGRGLFARDVKHGWVRRAWPGSPSHHGSGCSGSRRLSRKICEGHQSISRLLTNNGVGKLHRRHSASAWRRPRVNWKAPAAQERFPCPQKIIDTTPGTSPADCRKPRGSRPSAIKVQSGKSRLNIPTWNAKFGRARA